MEEKTLTEQIKKIEEERDCLQTAIEGNLAMNAKMKQEIKQLQSKRKALTKLSEKAKKISGG